MGKRRASFTQQAALTQQGELPEEEVWPEQRVGWSPGSPESVQGPHSGRQGPQASPQAAGLIRAPPPRLQGMRIFPEPPTQQ